MTLPPVPDSFYWTTESWGAALRCRALDEVSPQLFTTRQLELSAPAAHSQLARAVGADHVVTLKQVHGASVCVIRRGSVPPAPPEADVLVSDAADVAIAVRVADCVPLIMADRATGAVAAVHAGWRGTAAGAAVAALEAMRREFGTLPQHVVAAIGPSIGPCCYQVGSELVDAFAAAGHERYLIDRWFSTPLPPRGSYERPASADGSGEARRSALGARRRPQLRLNVAGANRDQLVLAGVPDAQIHDAGLCTAMHLDVLTSYRAEKANAGRIAGVIVAARR